MIKRRPELLLNHLSELAAICHIVSFRLHQRICIPMAAVIELRRRQKVLQVPLQNAFKWTLFIPKRLIYRRHLWLSAHQHRRASLDWRKQAEIVFTLPRYRARRSGGFRSRCEAWKSVPVKNRIFLLHQTVGGRWKHTHTQMIEFRQILPAPLHNHTAVM